MLQRAFRFVLCLLPVLFLGALALAPLLRLLAEGGAAWHPALLTDPYLGWRIGWSVLQAAVSCLLAALLGVPVAWMLARYRFAGRAAVLRLLMLPFVMPTLVAGVGVLSLFGPQGLLHCNLQDTPWLLLYGNLFYNLPLVIRAACDGFARVPVSRLAAARTLGATPWRAFWQIEWPVMLPWLGSALSLVFLYCFSGFGLALLLGGARYATVEVEIYSLVAFELNLADAGALALLVLLACGICAGLYVWLERRIGVPTRFDAVPVRQVSRPGERAGLACALGILLLFGAAPLLALAWRALAGFDPALFLDEEVQLALFNTARFTLMTLAGAFCMGVAHALAARTALWLRAAAFLPYIVSPVCTAFGLLLLYPALGASAWMLIGAYVLLAYPFVARALGQSLDALPPSLPAVARTLGAGPVRTFLCVELPLVRHAVQRGLAFAAATAVGEFAVTLFLSRPEWTTLTTLIYQRLGHAGAANLDAALQLSLLLMVFALLAFALIESLKSRTGEAHA